MELKAARIGRFDFGGRAYDSIRIEEVGSFSVPAALLEGKPIARRVLEVVSISVAPEPGAYVITPRAPTLTSELLAPGVRLEVFPKFGFDALAAVLEWSSYSVTALQEAAPVDVAEEGSIVDIFARRFIADLQPVLANGWVPSIARRRLESEDIRGAVDVLATYERSFSTGALTFVQHVNETHYRAAANRVLKTTLVCLAALGPRLPEGVQSQVAELLAGALQIPGYVSARQALGECETLLRDRPLDASRSYFYPAFAAARPILLAIGRSFGGSPELEDVPFRIDMPPTVEAAIRNVTAHAIGRRYVARKEITEHLYGSATPRTFNPRLEPDIVIRPVADMRRAVGLIDVKYKEQPVAGDHHQLAAYASAYGVRDCGFVTISDERHDRGVVATASRGDVDVFEYAIPAADARTGLREYGEWVRGLAA